jgi:hypothetical protein
LTINSTLCQIRELAYLLPTLSCDRCGQMAPRYSTTTRVALDIDLDHPVLLLITVSVHFCPSCRHYFRAQPPFLRPDASYTNRVIQKAVQAVNHDGMAFRRVADRLARDFWVRPSEGSLRRWCRIASQHLDLALDYLPWVVQEFSGVLCVDEVYQGDLALLLAVDPAAPSGDRLVGYQLVTGTVKQADIEGLLTRLCAAGIQPDQVITDGSSLYPNLLKQIWPAAAHQLCLFHETRRVTEAVQQVVRAVRGTLPKLPPAAPAPSPDQGVTRRRDSILLGRPRTRPLPDDPSDPLVQQWRARQAALERAKAQVHALHQRKVPIRAIARQTGRSRSTIDIWLQQPAPDLDPSDVVTLLENVHPAVQPRQLPPPPAGWASWEDLQAVRSTLADRRYLMLRRPDHLTTTEQALIDQALASPVGGALQVARSFLEDWYGFWTDEHGQRRIVAEARARYEAWQTNSAYQQVAPLQQVIKAVDGARFEQLSHFLKHPTWEATNNGAERVGRRFRQLQGPHFNLRTARSIEQALTAQSYRHYETATQPASPPSGRSGRGRKPASAGQVMAL